MTISLTGLLIIQFLWIRSAILIKEAELDEKVFSSLENVVYKTGFKQKANYIFNLSPKDSTESFTAEVKVMYTEGDSNVEVQQEIIRKPLGNSKSDNIIWTEKKGSDPVKKVHVITQGKNKEEVHKIIHEGGDSLNEIIVLSDTDSDLIHIEDIYDKVDKQTRVFEHTFRKLALEYIIDTIVPEKLIDKEELGGLLQQELQNSNIHTAYTWKVIKKEVGDISANTFEKENNKRIKRYTVSLFPDKVYSSSVLLEVIFEKSFWESISYLSGIHFSSLLFSLIIVLAYLFTFSLLMKQKKISEMKTDFINNMTHEFKTPIATINLAVDSINNPTTLKSEEKIKHFTSIIKDENMRMNQQVEKVLQMSTLEKHELFLQPEVQSLHATISAVAKSFQLILEKRKGSFSLNLHALNDEIIADEEHLKNIIGNIIDNAIKYTVDAPKIEITTNSDDKFVVLKVKDNGIGISKKNKHLIFDRFFRVHTGDVHNIKGFGVGLNYVREILEQMGGKIEVESEQGKGSTFTLLFRLIGE